MLANPLDNGGSGALTRHRKTLHVTGPGCGKTCTSDASALDDPHSVRDDEPLGVVDEFSGGVEAAGVVRGLDQHKHDDACRSMAGARRAGGAER
jgi:hypothetical protein